MDVAFATERVALGALPDPHRVADAGFRHVVVLVPGAEALIAEYRALGLTVLHEPIVDHTPGTVEQLTRIVASIDAAERAGDKVLVHCIGGKGRSGMAVAAWLVSRGTPGPEAIRAVRAVRPGAIETAAQEQRVLEFR